MILQKIADFWRRYKNLNLKIALVLISLQIIHLYWLTTDVVLERLVGTSFFAFPQIPLPLFVVIDYLEIPALIAGIAFYSLNVYRQRRFGKDFLLLVALAVQIFHLFWITDEVVYDLLLGTIPIQIPVYLAWIAISIDYLELPVIGDLFYKLFRKRTWNL